MNMSVWDNYLLGVGGTGGTGGSPELVYFGLLWFTLVYFGLLFNSLILQRLQKISKLK